ncbi:terminase small subunit [Lysobacter panacisoli]|uniref:Terminase small subunit n=1 Tax=Lysobacter panacisoli TaxID=1255263 RepID=A0ABP9LG69_9GAMM|nr:terminase small subunit [Lysobacter panacisoli]
MARPPIFETPEQFEEVANTYFATCEAKERPYTVNGLALALGMTRETLLRYGEKPEFSDAVKAVRATLEDYWEQRLAGPNAAGTIFWLKNQGWSDKTEQTITAEVVNKVERTIVKPA